MARVSQSDILARYSKRLSASKKWRKDEGIDDTWRRLNDFYRGNHYDSYAEEDRLIVNIGFSTVNVIAPSIAINYPKITVNATRSENAPNAIIAEAVVNYWMRHYNIKPQFRRAVKDNLIFGHGWVKVGYRFVEEGVVTDQQTSNADGEDIDTSDANEPAGEISSNLTILEDRAFVERVSPFDIFIDPDAVSLDECRWIAQRIRRPIGEIRSDKRYNKTARDAVEPVVYSKWSDHSANKKIIDKTQGYAEVWEYYDLVRGTLSVFADNAEAFLIKPTKMPYSFGHPFVMLRDYDVPDQFYPIGELEAIEPLQRELNETRTQMFNHRKRFSRKYLYKESAFDNAGRNALESDIDNTMVPVMSDEPLGGVVAPFPAVINPPEFYEQSNMIIADIDRVSGVSEFQRGGVSEVRRTATEAGLLQDAANARTSDKLAGVELALAEIARRLIALAQQFMTGTQVARIVGRDGVAAWVEFDREFIAGEFDFEVFAGSTQPVNESFRRQSALQMMDAMAPFAGSGIIDMPKLAAYVLQFGFGIKNPEQFMAPPPAPAPPPDQQSAAQQQPAPPVPAMPEQPPVDPAMLAMLAQQGQPQPPMGAPPMGGPQGQIDPAMLAAMLQQGGTMQGMQPQ